MCAGLRDAENLAWKLAGVLQGRYAPSLLDSYHSERYTHVRAVIKQAVQIGEIIQTRNPIKAFMRDTFLHLSKLVPKLMSGISSGRHGGLATATMTALPDAKSATASLQARITDKLDAFLPEVFAHAGRCGPCRFNAFWMRITGSPARLSLFPRGGSNDADLTEHEDFISDMAEQFNVCGYLLRPDRQIYAALKISETPLADQLEHHLQELSARLLADGQKREQNSGPVSGSQVSTL